MIPADLAREPADAARPGIEFHLDGGARREIEPHAHDGNQDSSNRAQRRLHDRVEPLEGFREPSVSFGHHGTDEIL
ncbi:MAG: hypothetical protein L3J78_01270 [Thermoplasmata archaeon]|nr:hypothetical protein [Thermoplasmata archaeon]